MDLRTLPDGLTPLARVNERRKRITTELGSDLSHVYMHEDQLGTADEKNCEQMFGAVPLPVGYAGPLSLTFSSGESGQIHLPLATTEGALVASVNRGCKAVHEGGVQIIESIHHGISRSIALRSRKSAILAQKIQEHQEEWRNVAEATSTHLRLQKYELDESGDFCFLTLYADTDEAMGMNMITIAAEAVGNWCRDNLDCEFVTVAANVDSDKKPSVRTLEKGRGYEVVAQAHLTETTIIDILKSTPDSMLAVADAKLVHGSRVAGALGQNLHAANIIAGLYLATGQDAAHVVEGSLAETTFEKDGDHFVMRVRVPALIVGLRGGGTDLPAQSECLHLLLRAETQLHKKQQLAESIAAAVLAGELSLLASQASHTLAKAHKKLGR